MIEGETTVVIEGFPEPTLRREVFELVSEERLNVLIKNSWWVLAYQVEKMREIRELYDLTPENGVDFKIKFENHKQYFEEYFSLLQQLLTYKDIEAKTRFSKAGEPLIYARSVWYAYVHKAKGGRLFAKGPSLQNLPSWVRNFITIGILGDLDIKSCHPTIIHFLAEKHGLDSTFLKEFEENRETHITEIATRIGNIFPKIAKEKLPKLAKRIICKVLYGGSMKYDNKKIHYEPLKRLFDGMKKLVNDLIVKDDAPYHTYHSKSKRVYKPEFSGLARVTNHIENAMLFVIATTIQQIWISRGHAGDDAECIHSLNFDGLMVPLELAEDESVRKAAEDAVFEKLGIRIQIVQKNFTALTAEDLEARYPGADQRDPLGEDDVPGLVGDWDDPVEEPDAGFMPDDTITSSYPDHQIVGSAAGMGMGKTVSIMHTILRVVRGELPGVQPRILFVTPRRAMVPTIIEHITKFDDLGREDKGVILKKLESLGISVSRYDDVFRNRTITPAEHPIHIIEYESLHRCDVTDGTWDIIVLDEFRAIFSSMCSTTNGEHLVSNAFRFQDILTNAKMVVATCAHLCVDPAGKKFMEFVESWRRDRREKELVNAMVRSLEEGDVQESDSLRREIARFKKAPMVIVHVPERARIRRRFIQARTIDMVFLAILDAKSGEKIMIHCGSKKFARILCRIMRKYAVGEVALYTSDEGDREDFAVINEKWTQYQVIIFSSVLTTGADFTAQYFHRVFFFPCACAAMPRDGHQGTGRARHVRTNQIWVAYDEEEEKIQNINRDVIDRALNTAVQYVTFGKGSCRILETDLFNIVRHDVETELPPAPTPPFLDFARAMNVMEAGFSQKIGDFLGYFKYLVECGDGTWERYDHGLTIAVKNQVSTLLAMEKSNLEEMDFAKTEDVDVTRIRDIDIPALNDLSQRKMITRTVRAELESQYPNWDLDDPVFVRTTLAKYDAKMTFPHLSDLKLLSVVKRWMKNKSILLHRRVAFSPEHETNIYVCDFLRQAETGVLGPAHPVVRVWLAKSAVVALGLKGFTDRSPITESKIDKVALANVVHDAKSFGIQYSNRELDGTPYGFVKTMLASTIGLKITKGNPMDVARDVLALEKLKPKTESAYDWFMSRGGRVNASEKKRFREAGVTVQILKDIVDRLSENPKFKREVSIANAVISVQGIHGVITSEEHEAKRQRDN